MGENIKCKTCNGKPEELEEKCLSCGFYHETIMEETAINKSDDSSN